MLDDNSISTIESYSSNDSLPLPSTFASSKAISRASLSKEHSITEEESSNIHYSYFCGKEYLKGIFCI